MKAFDYTDFNTTEIEAWTHDITKSIETCKDKSKSTTLPEFFYLTHFFT